MEGRYSNKGFSDGEVETNLSTQIDMEPRKVGTVTKTKQLVLFSLPEPITSLADRNAEIKKTV